MTNKQSMSQLKLAAGAEAIESLSPYEEWRTCPRMGGLALGRLAYYLDVDRSTDRRIDG
jgi:hypothetical protein